MQITGANDVDIMLDEDGQPVSDGNGDTALVSDDECWLQDIKNEAMTEEGELFYEDEEGDASYGWSLLDFMQGEYDDFTQMEIQQRMSTPSSLRKMSLLVHSSVRWHSLMRMEMWWRSLISLQKVRMRQR